MKKSRIIGLMAGLCLSVTVGAALAADYTITWKNELPAPGNQNACERTITAFSTNGSHTVIKPKGQLLFGYSNQPIRESITYSLPQSCSKIRLDIVCAYKDWDVTEFMTGTDIAPCRSTTAHIKLYRVDVD